MNRREFVLGLPLLAAAPALAWARVPRPLAEIGVSETLPGFDPGLLGTAGEALAALEQGFGAAGHRERMPFAEAMEYAARLLDVLQREAPTLAVYSARVRADLAGAGAERVAEARLPGTHRWALTEARLETPIGTTGTPVQLTYRVHAFPLDEALQVVTGLRGPNPWYRIPWGEALQLLDAGLSRQVRLSGIPLRGIARAYYLTVAALEIWPRGRHFLRDAAAALEVSPGLGFLSGRLRRVARYPHSGPGAVRGALETMARAAREETATLVGLYLHQGA